METALLVLVSLSLLLGLGIAWWMFSRARAVEERFEQFSALALVPDRLQALARVLEELDPPQLRAEIDNLRATLERIEDLAAVPPGSGGDEDQLERPQRVRALVARALRDEGYRGIRILDEDKLLLPDKAALRVECHRDGLRILGTIKVEGEKLVATDLVPSYTMFP